MGLAGSSQQCTTYHTAAAVSRDCARIGSGGRDAERHQMNVRIARGRKTAVPIYIPKMDVEDAFVDST